MSDPVTSDAEYAETLRRWVKATRYADEPVHTHDMIPAIERAIVVLEWMTDAERTTIENRIINDPPRRNPQRPRRRHTTPVRFYR